MRWIKSRKLFLKEEAKIKDVIFPTQAIAIKKEWGEEWLDMEEVEATDNIKQGKWKLSEDDKIEALSIFFGVKLKDIYESLGTLPDRLSELIKESISLDLLKDDPKWEVLLNNFDIKKPTINQISVLHNPIFRKISVSESKADEIIIRDESGRPILDENNRPTKRPRKEGEVLFTKNLVNINSFISDFNAIYPDMKVDESMFSTGEISKVVGASSEDFSGNRGYKVEVDVYAKDMFLSIKHNPKDILNMSISKFYASCQHLYTGGHREKVIGNVFDPNTIPAFFIFDSPIYNSENIIISDQLPLCRMMIRNIESFDSTGDVKLFFDRAYPDRMKDFMGDVIERYTENKMGFHKSDRPKYIFTPDIPIDADIREPYMDILNLYAYKFIGQNTKYLCLNNDYDWSKIKISPKAKLEEVIIETTKLPSNFFNLNITPNWIKIRFIKLNSLSEFNNINCDSWAFDKCKFDAKILSDIKGLKNLKIISCDTLNIGSISNIEGLEELHLIYTIEPSELESIITNTSIKSLVISGDVVPHNKKFINSLKQKGVKVQIIGPVI